MYLIQGTITIIYNSDTLSWFDNLLSLICQSKTNVILSINQDNYDLIDYKYDELCENIKFTNSLHTKFPLYFDNGKNTYFQYNQTTYLEIINELKLDINNIEDSIYNCIYYKIPNKIILIIRKYKYGTKSHRYLIAYDPMEFTQDELNKIIYYIFCL